MEELSPEVVAIQTLETTVITNHTESVLILNSINNSLNTLNILLVGIIVVLAFSSMYEIIHHFYDSTIRSRYGK